MYTFDKMIDLVKEKYVKSKAIDNTVIGSFLEDFFSYFRRNIGLRGHIHLVPTIIKGLKDKTET